MFDLNYKTKLQMGGVINQSHNVGDKDKKNKQKVADQDLESWTAWKAHLKSIKSDYTLLIFTRQ